MSAVGIQEGLMKINLLKKIEPFFEPLTRFNLISAYLPLNISRINLLPKDLGRSTGLCRINLLEQYRTPRSSMMFVAVAIIQVAVVLSGLFGSAVSVYFLLGLLPVLTYHLFIFSRLFPVRSDYFFTLPAHFN